MFRFWIRYDHKGRHFYCIFSNCTIELRHTYERCCILSEWYFSFGHVFTHIQQQKWKRISILSTTYNAIIVITSYFVSPFHPTKFTHPRFPLEGGSTFSSYTFVRWRISDGNIIFHIRRVFLIFYFIFPSLRVCSFYRFCFAVYKTYTKRINPFFHIASTTIE